MSPSTLCFARPFAGLAISLSLAACAGQPAAPSLTGTEWRLEALGDSAVMERSQATLAFPETGQVAGNGSCNRFFGSVRIAQGQIGFGQMGSTKMACLGPANEQETRYLAALQKAERYELQGRTLLIHVQGMAKPLRFVQTAP
ncbi:MAG: META domain-containing protein [Hydrogenophaga sp.]|uniref:META domain-containing protein n=1 Tax=Hydrogenophaga sp. TaxID=1904254 RepID=UPI00272F464A|nr:META domain-containing protein [Hydrogenophaga sp.]MDP2407354.1 META domain-containing protein [Hydrogenophaga sp.]MDZ4177191.1 META domain-containing protein [Hydrogenophaga sp.]